MTLLRSMTDIHLVGRQDEGIEGIDPVRHGRFAARRIVDPNGHNNKKLSLFCWVTHLLPHLNINVYYTHGVRFVSKEIL